MHGLLVGVECDLVRPSPLVKLDLAFLRLRFQIRIGRCQRESAERIQIISKNDFAIAVLMQCLPRILIEHISKPWTPHRSLVDHILKIEWLGLGATNNHHCFSLVKPRRKHLDDILPDTFG